MIEVGCSNMLSHIVSFASIWQHVLPDQVADHTTICPPTLSPTMLSLWMRPWTASNKEICHAGPIRFVGRELYNCLLSEWHGWWEKSGCGSL